MPRFLVLFLALSSFAVAQQTWGRLEVIPVRLWANSVFSQNCKVRCLPGTATRNIPQGKAIQHIATAENKARREARPPVNGILYFRA